MKHTPAAAALAIAAFCLHATATQAAPVRQMHPVAAAMVAKIIGETCPGALMPAETAEISRYLEHSIAIEKAKGADEKLETESLVATLDIDYRSNRTCGIGDTELARDILLRVRNELEIIP